MSTNSAAICRSITLLITELRLNKTFQSEHRDGTARKAISTGSVLSEGNIWVIIAVAVLALGYVAALAVVKKKKKPVAANGAGTEDEE